MNELPWYLSTLDESKDESNPDYIITSGQDAIPACLHLTKANTNKNCYSSKYKTKAIYKMILTAFYYQVYLGYPGIPFINFDQVVLPKYEANAKMGKKINKLMLH